MFNKTEQEIIKNWQGDISVPVVSICSITYNHESYIEEAIGSFLMQETDFPFEIVIGEDCSTDGTRKVIEEYVNEYPNIIRLITSNSNVGMFQNGIRTIKACRGKYIANCDGDDFWRDPSKLQIQVNFLDKNLDYVLSQHDSAIVDINSNITKESKATNNKDYTTEEMICFDPFILTNTIMYRNIHIEDYLSSYVNALNMDTVIYHLLGLHSNGKAKYQNNIIPAAYRIHDSGVWRTLSNIDRMKKITETKKILLKNLNNNEYTLKIVQSMERRFSSHLILSIRQLNIDDFVLINKYILSDQIFSLATLIKIYLIFIPMDSFKMISSKINNFFKKD